jgi:hypothetical protein
MRERQRLGLFGRSDRGVAKRLELWSKRTPLRIFLHGVR